MGFFILLIIILALFSSCIKIVPQAEAFVVEFLGSYQATWGNGLHLKIPVFQKVARKVSLKEQVADFPPQPVITKDNVSMQIDTIVFYQITDPKLFTYGVENPVMALANLAATTLRNVIGELELDQTLTGRDVINARLQQVLDVATDPWGIKVNRVELKNIIPPREIQESMEKQMKAEREKRQTLLEAEAHKESSITRAEGDKQAAILKAEAERDAAIARATGKAESIRLIYEAEAQGIEKLKAAQMDESVLTLKKLDALKSLGDGRATKLVIPTNLVESASDLMFKGDILGLGDKADPSAKEIPVMSGIDECCDDEERSAVTKEQAKVSGDTAGSYFWYGN